MVGWGDQRWWSEAGHCAVPPPWRQNQSGYLHLWKPNSGSLNSCLQKQQALLSVIKFKRCGWSFWSNMTFNKRTFLQFVLIGILKSSVKSNVNLNLQIVAHWWSAFEKLCYRSLAFSILLNWGLTFWVHTVSIVLACQTDRRCLSGGEIIESINSVSRACTTVPTFLQSLKLLVILPQCNACSVK